MHVNNRDAIVRYTNEYLGLFLYKDYGPMGMQFVGTEDVNRIATCVSVTADVINRAGMMDIDMIICHHGLFWNSEPHTYDNRMELRLSGLEEWDMSLLGYHLCLDAHPEVGNNILAAQAIGLENLVPFAEIGWGGDLKEGVNVMNRVGNQFANGQVIHYFMNGDYPIKRACVITGGGGNYIHEAVNEGYDLLLTGEAEEPSKALAKELGIHFIAAGHYATERAGVKVLGEHIAKQFDLEHFFIDIHNPI